MPKLIVAHDYQCPWAWIAISQVRRLKSEFPLIEVEWVGYELLPDGADRPPRRPSPAARFLMLAESEGVSVPGAMPAIVSTHAALEGAEYFKEHAPDRFDAYNDAVYGAMWASGRDVSNVGLLRGIADSLLPDAEDFSKSLAERRYRAKIKAVGPASYAEGITHVPTFVFPGERCSEATYGCLREMGARFAERYLGFVEA